MKKIVQLFVIALLSSSIASVIGISNEELEIKQVPQPRQFPCPEDAQIYPCQCSPVNGRLYMDCSAATSNAQLNQIFATADFIATDFYQFTMDGNTALSSLDFSFNEVFFEKFDIKDCAFTEITTQFFSTSSSALKSINLSGNSQLIYFPFSSLQLTENVTTLTIFNSGISYVPPIISPKLADFTLANSPVPSILPGTFSQVTTLSHLSFAYDEISVLRTNSVPICSDEMVLDFSNNSIINIEANSFYESNQGYSIILTLLDLSYNQLTSLGKDTIPLTGGSGNQIRLDNNMIDTLDTDIFYNVPTGDTGATSLNIHLENNRLKELNQTTFEIMMPKLLMIWADGNPLECACDIAWIVTNSDYLSKISPATTCADGVYVKDLDPIFFTKYC